MSRLTRALLAAPFLLAAPALATTLLALDLPALTKGSATIVRGTVTKVEARWTPDGARIMTDATLAVSERWKGEAGDTVVVMQPGGVVGDTGQLVHGTARFAVGEEVVVFLERRGTRFLLTGMAQGKFRVETSSDGSARYARQEPEGEARLIDPATRQSVAAVPQVLTLDVLRAKVLALAGALAPATPSSGPVKVTP